MNKSIILLVCLLAVSFTSDKLIKTKVATGITVLLPVELQPMTPDDLAQRFPSVRAPLGAYTNLDRTVDFSVNISATKWPDGDAEMAKGFFKASLYNLYDRIEMISEGTQVLHKKKYVYFEFTSRISGDSRKQELQNPILKYTFIQYLVTPKRTLVFTFICSKELKDDWQEIANEIMKSVRVK